MSFSSETICLKDFVDLGFSEVKATVRSNFDESDTVELLRQNHIQNDKKHARSDHDSMLNDNEKENRNF